MISFFLNFVPIGALGKMRATYGGKCGNHYEAGGECNLVALDHRCARRPDLVYRLGDFELCVAVSLRTWNCSPAADGSVLGHPHRCATRLRYVLTHLLRSRRTQESRSPAL